MNDPVASLAILQKQSCKFSPLTTRRLKPARSVSWNMSSSKKYTYLGSVVTNLLKLVQINWLSIRRSTSARWSPAARAAHSSSFARIASAIFRWASDEMPMISFTLFRLTSV